MKLLVFAHTPPPHHGQSYMVQLMLEGFGGDWRKRLRKGKTAPQPGDEYGIQCYHVNAQVSDDLQDVGGVRIGKIARLLRFCTEAIWCRLRHGVDTLYYVPAPAKRSAILRDWIVLLLVRPWFKRMVLHWHAFGLGHWVAGKTEYPMGPEGPKLPPPRLFGGLEKLARSITRALYRCTDVSIVLTRYNQCDAELLVPRRMEIVPNGIPDPCPGFEAVLAQRQKRATNRAQNEPILALYLGHCMESKGLLDAVRICSNAQGARLIVAGKFPSAAEQTRFEKLVDELGFRDRVEIAGFVSGETKRDLLTRADILLFPTKYPAETFGLVVLEAYAFGLPAITSNWRGVPELQPQNCRNLLGSDNTVVALDPILSITPEQLRSHFLQHFDLAMHLRQLASRVLTLT